jgi:hypothetical protein
MDVYKSLAGDPRPIEAMNRAQVGLVVGLEKVLKDSSLVLVCPRCAAEGHGLDTANAMTDEIWKIDCQCRRRRSAKTDAMMVPSGWLLLMVPDLLASVSLDVRCPSPTCLLKPLTVEESADGMTVTVRCHCAAHRQFKKKKKTQPH